MIAHLWQPGSAAIWTQLLAYGSPIALLAAIAWRRGWLDNV